MRRFGEAPISMQRARPDPLALASRRAEIVYWEAQIVGIREQQRRAREHLTVLAEEQTEQMEALRADRARLAALDVMANAAGGRIPDQETEEERRKLRVRLEERPASLAAALQGDLERLDSEAKELTERVESAKRALAKEEEVKKQFDEEYLEGALDRMHRGIASPGDIQIVHAANAWPDKRYQR